MRQIACVLLLAVLGTGCANTSWNVSSDIPGVAYAVAKQMTKVSAALPRTCSLDEGNKIEGAARSQTTRLGATRDTFQYKSSCVKLAAR